MEKLTCRGRRELYALRQKEKEFVADFCTSFGKSAFELKMYQRQRSWINSFEL